jgi:DNA-binding MarR family transcriptional regulator
MTDDHLLAAQAELFGTIFVVTQHLTRRADAALTSLGLTTHQWLLLAVLTKWSPDRSPSLSEAASRYGSSRQNVKQIALGLQSRGFLHLVPDPDDGRTTRLVLTDRVGHAGSRRGPAGRRMYGALPRRDDRAPRPRWPLARGHLRA